MRIPKSELRVIIPGMFAIPLSENPFAILTAIVAPAVLTNACSVLALGTSNRVARVVDRTRAVTAEIGHAAEDDSIHSHLEHQLKVLRIRARMLVSALRMAYLALGGFASSALVSVIGGGLGYFGIAPGYRTAALIGVIIGVVSVGALTIACALMVRETTMAIENLQEEAEVYSAVRNRDGGQG